MRNNSSDAASRHAIARSFTLIGNQSFGTSLPPDPSAYVSPPTLSLSDKWTLHIDSSWRSKRSYKTRSASNTNSFAKSVTITNAMKPGPTLASAKPDSLRVMSRYKLYAQKTLPKLTSSKPSTYQTTSPSPSKARGLLRLKSTQHQCSQDLRLNRPRFFI